eukprot:m.43632 g.43632  ORF g.43632 m.43632 type:complete len:406 (+) comp12048_c0_seq1:495-1712(+)
MFLRACQRPLARSLSCSFATVFKPLCAASVFSPLVSYQRDFLTTTRTTMASLTDYEEGIFKFERDTAALARQVAQLSHSSSSRTADVIPMPTAEDMSNEAFGKRDQEIRSLMAQLQAKVDVLRKQFEDKEIVRLQKENEALRKEIAGAKQTLRCALSAKGERMIPVPGEDTTVADSGKVATSSTTAPTTSAPAEPAKKASKAEGAASQAGAQDKKAAKKEKKVKAKQPKEEGSSQPAANDDNIDVSRIDFRVGVITEAKMHPDADSLYVETIDVGEPTPRTIISGLAKFVPLEEMQNRKVVICCNLKPRKMRGIMSQGMVMCAKVGDTIEPLSPPEGAVAGDPIDFEKYPRKPDAELNPKKKIFEAVQPELFTNADGVANYRGDAFIVKGKGPCFAKVAKNGTVS